MESIRSNFNTARLPIIPYKDSKDYFAIGPGVEDSLELLEASMVELNTMLNSKYISPLLAEVEKLYKKMVGKTSINANTRTLSVGWQAIRCPCPCFMAKAGRKAFSFWKSMEPVSLTLRISVWCQKQWGAA